MRTLLVLLLSFAPFLVVLVHQRATRRHADVLQTVPSDLMKTVMWRRAEQYLTRRTFPIPRPKGAAPSTFAYWFSLLLVSVVMLFSWNFALDCPLGGESFVNEPNRLLYAPFPAAGSDRLAFQGTTLSVTILAFVVAYTRVVFSMAVDVNTGGFSAAGHLFNAVHLMSAVLVAGLARIMADGMGWPAWTALLLAFLAGLRPDFWLIGLGRAAHIWLTNEKGPLAVLRTPARPALGAGGLPSDLPLQVIDGMDDATIDRMGRIDIHSCHRLAMHNPFVIWLRTNATLHEIVDWFGQALLALYFPSQMVTLRNLGVRTVMDLVHRIDAGSVTVAEVIAKDMAEAVRAVAMLRAVPQVAEQLELSAALRAIVK